MELLTEQGYIATGLDTILSDTGVPKGSFYYYFSSKEEFGLTVLSAYGDYFARLLDQSLTDDSNLEYLSRINEFCYQAESGMARHQFRRGCLIGNLSQESGLLTDRINSEIVRIFADWESRISICIELGQQSGEIKENLDADHLARLFWLGWEGAVTRSRLMASAEPLKQFRHGFIQLITKEK